MPYSSGSSSGAQILTDDDDIYPAHINELRQSRGSGSAIVGRTTGSEYYCDGTADDIQINAAIVAVNAAGGGTVFIKAGTYSIVNPILMLANVSFVGENWSAKITMPATTNKNFINVTTVDNVQLKDFQIDGSGQTASLSCGIVASTTNNLIIENLYIHNCYNMGIECPNVSYYTKILRNLVTDCAYGIHTRLVNGLIDGNIVLRSNVDNIYLHTGTDGCIVSNNTCNDAVTRNGISQDLGRDVVYSGNICRNNTWFGIYVELVLTPVTIENNICTENGISGIRVTSTPGAVVVGNYCRGCDSGISVRGDYSVISGNKSERNSSSGIVIDRNKYVTCQGNVVFNNSQLLLSTSYGIHIFSLSPNYSTRNLVSGNICIDDQASDTSLLSSNANSAQKVVTVADGTQFFEGEHVTISDDTPQTENNQIDTISGNDLTMITDLTNTYTTAQNAVVNGRASQSVGIYETNASDDYNTIINNECLGNINGQILTKGAHTEVSHNRTM